MQNIRQAYKKTLSVSLGTSTKILPSPFPTSDACVPLLLGLNNTAGRKRLLTENGSRRTDLSDLEEEK